LYFTDVAAIHKEYDKLIDPNHYFFMSIWVIVVLIDTEISIVYYTDIYIHYPTLQTETMHAFS